MATITNNIRWADNTAELKANLASGVDQIEAMHSSVDRLTASMGGSGLLKAANTLTAAVDQLGGSLGITGGVMKLTSDEQDRASATLDKAIAKYEALGQTAPTAMLQLRDALAAANTDGGTFASWVDSASTSVLNFAGSLGGLLSVGALLGAVTNTIQWGLELDRLSQQLGLGTDAIQGLNYAAVATNTPMQTLTQAITQMERKIGQDDGNLIKGLSDLGLQFSIIKNESPEQQFNDITTALSGVTNQTEFAADAADIFNSRSGTSIAAVIRQWQDLQEQSAGSNAIMDADTTQALADMGKQWALLKLQAEAYFAWLATRPNSDKQKLASDQDKLGVDQTGEQQAQFDISQTQLPSMINALPPPAAFNADTVAMENLNAATKDGAANLAALKKASDDLAASAEKSIPANLKFGDAWTNLNSIGASYLDTLNSIDPAIKDSVTYYASIGATVKDLTAAFPQLTKAQAESAVQAQKSGQALTDAYQKVDDEIAADQTAMYGTDLEKAQAAADKKYDAAVASANKLGIVDVGYYNALWALRDLDVTKNDATIKSLYAGSLQGLEAALENAQSAYSDASSAGLTLSRAQWDLLRGNVDKAADALRNFGSTGVAANASVTKGATDAANAYDVLAQKISKSVGGVIDSSSKQIAVTFATLSDAEQGVSDGLLPINIQVQNLDGSVSSLADAIKKLDMGNSITYDLSTDQGLAYYKQLNPAATSTWTDSQIEAFTKAGGTLQQLINGGIINPYGAEASSNMIGIPGFATGVKDFSGGLAMVGEMGPELLNLPAHSDLSPAGTFSGAGGMGDTYITNVKGVFGTMDQVTRAVSQGIAAGTNRKVTAR